LLDFSFGMGFNQLKREREVRKFVEELGGTVLSITCNKHWKIRAAFKDKQLTIVLSKTPSDHRTWLNKKSEIRNQLK
jgi:hypothetical protein